MKRLVETYLEFLKSTAIAQNPGFWGTHAANPKKSSPFSLLKHAALTYRRRHLMQDFES